MTLKLIALELIIGITLLHLQTKLHNFINEKVLMR